MGDAPVLTLSEDGGKCAFHALPVRRFSPLEGLAWLKYRQCGPFPGLVSHVEELPILRPCVWKDEPVSPPAALTPSQRPRSWCFLLPEGQAQQVHESFQAAWGRTVEGNLCAFLFFVCIHSTC